MKPVVASLSLAGISMSAPRGPSPGTTIIACIRPRRVVSAACSHGRSKETGSSDREAIQFGRRGRFWPDSR
jgi:hypothetical protein